MRMHEDAYQDYQRCLINAKNSQELGLADNHPLVQRWLKRAEMYKKEMEDLESTNC